MISYIDRTAAIASDRVIMVTIELIRMVPESYSVWIHRSIRTDGGITEITFDSRGERLTIAGAKARAEDLAARHGIERICLEIEGETA
jgi:hypothetical protein